MSKLYTIFGRWRYDNISSAERVLMGGTSRGKTPIVCFNNTYNKWKIAKFE